LAAHGVTAATTNLGRRRFYRLFRHVELNGAMTTRSGRSLGSFKDKSGINIMKGYMEDGAFSRGAEIINAEGSIVFVGNLDRSLQFLGA
jgi:Putative ATP-dependent Lon protease